METGPPLAQRLVLKPKQCEQMDQNAGKGKQVPGSLAAEESPSEALVWQKGSGVTWRFRKAALRGHVELVTKEEGNFNQGLRPRRELDYHNL